MRVRAAGIELHRCNEEMCRLIQLTRGHCFICRVMKALEAFFVVFVYCNGILG